MLVEQIWTSTVYLCLEIKTMFRRKRDNITTDAEIHKDLDKCYYKKQNFKPVKAVNDNINNEPDSLLKQL